MSKIELRPHQSEAIMSLRDGYREGKKRQVLSAPTGSGKTIMTSYLIDSARQRGEGSIIFLVDRVALVNQSSRVLDEYDIPHGVIQANHWRWRPWERVQVASIQTLTRRQWPEKLSFVYIDECHGHNAAILKHLRAADCAVLGGTATPYGAHLGKFYDGVVQMGTTDGLIEQGWLKRYRFFSPSAPDMEGVAVKSTGEWEEEEASKRAVKIVGDVVESYARRAAGRKFIAFGVETKHCAEMARAFTAAGVETACYTYLTGEREREILERRLKDPDDPLMGLTSVAAISKGFDAPIVSCVIHARPLRTSVAELIQGVGRGFRQHPGAQDCIVLDHGGSLGRLGPEMFRFFREGAAALPSGKVKVDKEKKKRDPADPVQCPACTAWMLPAPRCNNCAFEFPRRSRVITERGELIEVGASGWQSAIDLPTGDRLLRQLEWIRRASGFKPGWLGYTFKELTGNWPQTLDVAGGPERPTDQLVAFVKVRLDEHRRQAARAARARARQTTPEGVNV